jgi:hypothetical protein
MAQVTSLEEQEDVSNILDGTLRGGKNFGSPDSKWGDVTRVYFNQIRYSDFNLIELA